MITRRDSLKKLPSMIQKNSIRAEEEENDGL